MIGVCAGAHCVGFLWMSGIGVFREKMKMLTSGNSSVIMGIRVHNLLWVKMSDGLDRDDLIIDQCSQYCVGWNSMYSKYLIINQCSNTTSETEWTLGIQWLTSVSCRTKLRCASVSVAEKQSPTYVRTVQPTYVWMEKTQRKECDKCCSPTKVRTSPFYNRYYEGQLNYG